LYVRDPEADLGEPGEGTAVIGEPRRVGLDADAYDRRWARLEAAGHNAHGEADLVERLIAGARRGTGAGQPRVLDAGCGTGRVAIRLAERGIDTEGVDRDPALLEHARAKAPGLVWREADLATLGPDDAPGPFDAIVMAGNVMIFLAPGTEAAVVANLAVRLAPGGVLVAGFQLRRGGLTRERYDACAHAAGLVPTAHFATWDGEDFVAGGDYVVVVSKRPDT
jgi:SAM-dependent methyltransferase